MMSRNIWAADPQSRIDIIIILILTHCVCSLQSDSLRMSRHQIHSCTVPDGIKEFGDNLTVPSISWFPICVASSKPQYISHICCLSRIADRRLLSVQNLTLSSPTELPRSRAPIGIHQRQGRRGRYPPQRSGHPASGRGRFPTCETIHRERVRTSRNLKGKPTNASRLLGGMITNRGGLGQDSSQSTSGIRNYRLEASNNSASAPV